MPANVVKNSRDEHLWNKAKSIAKEAGRSGDYAYIMGIFQKMSGKKSFAKSFSVPARWRNERIPGQVPGQGGSRLDRLMDMPAQKGGLAILDHTEPRLTPESIVKGLGFSLSEENDWRGWLGRNMGSASNEVVARKSLYERFIENQTPPELRRAIFQRSMSYFKGLRKSVVQIVTPDELLQKSGKKDLIPGGLADKKKLSDFDPDQIEAGMKVEREHTKNPDVAREIARDHLTEDPDYYRKLARMEGGSSTKKSEQHSSARGDIETAVRKLLASNPNPDDSEVHALAEKHGWEVDDVEETIYTLAARALHKAEARGGSYYRRVANKGGGFRYYYDADKYHSREDAHANGEEALKKRLQKMLVSHVERAGEGGCNHEGFKSIAERFGVDKVATILRESTAEGGPLKFDKGLFTLRGSLQKSERFILKR